MYPRVCGLPEPCDMLSVYPPARSGVFERLSACAANPATLTRLADGALGTCLPPSDPGLCSPAFSDSHGDVQGNSCQFAHFCANVSAVNGREFMTRVRRLARRNGIAVRFDRTRGKGSHGTLYYGDRHTVVKDRKTPL